MVHIIDKQSSQVGKAELNFFGAPPTQVAAERASWYLCHARNTVSEVDTGAPISFHLSGIPEYLDFRKNLLKLKLCVKKADGNILAGTEEVAVINYLCNTIFKQVKIFLSNKIIYDSQDTYFYRSYIETLINGSECVKNTQLQISGWYDDKIGEEETTINGKANPGFILRNELIAGS